MATPASRSTLPACTRFQCGHPISPALALARYLAGSGDAAYVHRQEVHITTIYMFRGLEQKENSLPHGGFIYLFIYFFFFFKNNMGYANLHDVQIKNIYSL